MRILYINPFSGFGGAEQSLVTLLLYLEKTTDYDLHLLLPDEGVLSEKLKNTSVKVHYLFPPSSFTSLSRVGLKGNFQLILVFIQLLFTFPFYLFSLASFVKTIKPDVIHTNGIKSHVAASLLPMSLAKIRLIWHWRIVPVNKMVRFVLSILSHRIFMSIANSKFTEKSVPVSAHLVKTVYNPIDCKRYSPVEFDYTGYEFLKDRIVISVVSVLAANKGVDTVISALAPLLNESDSYALVIVGDEIYETSGHQGYKTKLEELAALVTTKEKVLFVGFQHDVNRWMSLAQVVVYFSEAESFGRVVAESLACKTPVVASAVGGIPEILEDGKTGFLIERDRESLNSLIDNLSLETDNLPLVTDSLLLEKVKILLNDHELRRKMGERGREFVMEQFSVEQHGEGIKNIYEQNVNK